MILVDGRGRCDNCGATYPNDSTANFVKVMGSQTTPSGLLPLNYIACYANGCAKKVYDSLPWTYIKGTQTT